MHYLKLTLIVIMAFLTYCNVSSVNELPVRIDPVKIFTTPPETAKPGVLWMWMGSNISREGITKDLEALGRSV